MAGRSPRRAVGPAHAQGRTKGTLLIVGGGPQPPALVRAFMRRAVMAIASAEGLTGGEENVAEAPSR